MEPMFDIQWIGHRKDGSSRGSIYGWFVLKGHKISPAYKDNYDAKYNEDDNIAYIIRGRIGKQLHIEEHIITYEFLSEISSKKQNFRSVEHDKIMSTWGKVFEDELNMFKMIIRLKYA